MRCAKFGDFSFSRFDFIVRADSGQTEMITAAENNNNIHEVVQIIVISYT